ncbi:hypothetical protein EC973_003008 [Apophysomyces ossiformis]|uniref:ER-bound oxygenase mpaB/mpaB'/Rubber oxygenase catalytic domain-containing protein n=1 Tax=Apophysomyces ossiformis TaxID=679940 RepID=A0A8H7BTK0_9FUNG|nr:hypothetical protein EC973_003008 [Apophysomyces ossiformis]
MLDSVLTWIKEAPPQKTGAGVAAASLACYLLVVRHYRYRYVKEMRRKYPDPDMVLKDASIAAEIYSISGKEFPFMNRQAMEMATFKTFTVPSMSRLLYSTREIHVNTSRRVEDTELILSEMVEPYARVESELQYNPNLSEQEITKQYARKGQAIKRLNEIHDKFKILNDDFIYTLSLFILVPIRWINKYEYRKLDQREINAYYRTWYDIGVDMKIKDIPDTLEKLEAFMEEYERRKVLYHPVNPKLAEATLQYGLKRLPAVLRPLVRELFPCILEPRSIDAFQMKHPSWLLQSLFDGALHLRAFVVRHFFLPRRYHSVRTPFYPNKEGKYIPNYCSFESVYRNGYEISSLGPAKFCPVKH